DPARCFGVPAAVSALLRSHAVRRRAGHGLSREYSPLFQPGQPSRADLALRRFHLPSHGALVTALAGRTTASTSALARPGSRPPGRALFPGLFLGPVPVLHAVHIAAWLLSDARPAGSGTPPCSNAERSELFFPADECRLSRDRGGIDAERR